MTNSANARRVLVTGAAGFIGSHVCERLLANGYRVFGVDNFDPFYPRPDKEHTLREIAHANLEFIEADITDAPAMRTLFDRVRPEGVIHLAAKAGVRPSIADPAGYMNANVTGTAVILDQATRTGCSRVVAASSSSVYGNAPQVPFAETMDVNAPISPYAASKRACELLGSTHHHLTRMPVAMLRFFTVFGPRQRPDLAIALFLRRVARGETITLLGAGTTSRDYTYIDDIVDGVLRAYERIDAHGYRVWNLGHSSPVTLDDMVATIGRVVGKTPKIDRKPAQAGDVERTFADLTRSRTELGYTPKTAFEAGVARQWAWMKERL